MRSDELKWFLVGAAMSIVFIVGIGFITQLVTKELLGIKMSVLFGALASLVTGIITWSFKRMTDKIDSKLDKEEFKIYKEGETNNKEELTTILEDIQAKQTLILNKLMNLK